jgi:acetylglutamate kinase
MKPELLVLKIGGNVLDHAPVLAELLREVTTLEKPLILVHGGGKVATQLGERLGIRTQMVDGRRITDADTLQLVTMVYAGLLNKNVVAQLQAMGCNALGLTGADANCMPARKRSHPEIDYGWVGDVDPALLDPAPFQHMLQIGWLPVLCALTHDQKGHLLNTNADTIAASVAICMAAHYRVRLLYCFEKPGVLRNVEDLTSLVEVLNPDTYTAMRKEGTIFAGMIPKLDNAFATLQQGVSEVALFQPADFLAVANHTGRNFTRIVL